MAIVQEFDLNMIPDSAPVIVHVNQYDEGEGRFEIHLYDGNVPYVPAAGAEAIIQGTKPDGKGFDYNATLSGSTVTADVTKQMTAVAGVVRVQVVITEGDNVTGTFVFGMDVQKSGLPADTDMSASEYQIVEQMIEAAEEAEAVATQSAEDAEAWAVGQRSGEDVPSTDPTYHNNSKYWAGKAHEELENKADLVDGKVPSSQLPSYVDDVVEGYYNEQDGKFYEESTFIHEITPERSKIYVDLGADITYRWSGSEYVAISNPDIAEDIVTSIVDSAADYPVPTAGETLKVIIGKIKKYLADLKGKLDTFKSKGSATKGIYFDANGDAQEMSYSVRTSVPSDAIFTDSHVRQSSADSSEYSRDYRVLLSEDANDYTDTGGFTRKSSKCTVNPYTGNLKIVQINGVNVGVSPKFTDSGHTILDSSGTAMAQRGKLQFDGATVTDDPANDKTIVTGTPQSMIGDAWVLGHAYAVGDYSIDANGLYKNGTAHTSTATNRPSVNQSGYWTLVSVASELGGGRTKTVIWDSGDVVSSNWTVDNTYSRLLYSKSLSASDKATILSALNTYKHGQLYIETLYTTSSGTRTVMFPIDKDNVSFINGYYFTGTIFQFEANIELVNNSVIFCLYGNNRDTYKQYTFRTKIIAIA